MSEVIDTSEFQFKGKHAEYVFKLTSEIDTRTKFRIFQRNIDVLIFASIVGKLYGKRSKVDNNTSIKPVKINYQQLTRESSVLDYNKELILLLNSRDENNDINGRINKTFRYIYDNKQEYQDKKIECEQEYLEFVLGGVEILYEKIMSNAKTIDDYIDNIYEFIEDIQEIIGSSKMEDDELYNLCMKAEKNQN